MYVIVLTCICFGLSAGMRDLRKPYYLRYNSRNYLRNIKVLNLNDTYFSSLKNYEVNARPANETTYPWIARVVHSASIDLPHVCTASCIDAAIFITAARCLYTLKVNYTTVIYKSKYLRALAFVFPSVRTKQAFDDIGFIVVKSQKVIGTWSVIELFTAVNRTDDAFKWFGNLDYTYGNINTKVLGYAAKKSHGLGAQPHYLTELDVVVGLDICPSILTRSTNKTESEAYLIPCYHSCTFVQMLDGNELCRNYHGVEGGAIFDTITNKLIGVATWGSNYDRHELPVGFSFANSETFYKDFTCAQRIRDDNGVLVTRGYYQSLCDA